MTHSPRAVRGVFHAIFTRDGQSLDRDGQPFVAARMLDQEHPIRAEGCIYEVQFVDGFWMLASENDLEFYDN